MGKLGIDDRIHEQLVHAKFSNNNLAPYKGIAATPEQRKEVTEEKLVGETQGPATEPVSEHED